MDRRHFLHALLAGAGAALVPGFARAGDPAQFAAGLARDPWLAEGARVLADMTR